MSWKAVELQVALPRTQDAGKMLEQIQNRGQTHQSQLAAQMTADTEHKRKKTQELEQKDWKDMKHTKQSVAQKQPQGQLHPYKGQNVDYSG